MTATVTKAQREQTSPSSLRSAIEKSSAPIPHLLEPRVLLYHRVIDDPIDSQLLAVSPKNFEAQLEILNKHYRVLGLEELVEEMRSGIYKENTIALSFDDGYFDNAQYALPLLEQYNVPATFFLTTSFIGSHKELYWDALERLLLIEKPPIEVLALDTNNGPFELDLKTSKARFESYEILCDTLKQLDAQKRDEFLQQLYQLTGLEYSARHSHRAMSWEEVSILHASPVAEIGVHTVHHTCLASLSEEDQRRELAEAKRILEHELSTEMSLCSYPWGSASDFTMATMRIAREVGFQAGIANIQSACKQPVDLYQVPRLLVRNYDGQEFLRWLDSTQGQAMEQAQIAKRSERLGNLHNEANHSAY